MAFQLIDREECIGDSLVKINDNSSTFDTRINSISANFINNINGSTNITVSLTGVPQTAIIQAKGPGVATGWVSFQGVQGVGAGFATTISQYNISSIINKTSSGNYTIQFPVPRLDTNYVIFACVADKTGTPGIFCIKAKRNDGFDVTFRVPGGQFYDPTLVDLVVYGL